MTVFAALGDSITLGVGDPVRRAEGGVDNPGRRAGARAVGRGEARQGDPVGRAGAGPGDPVRRAGAGQGNPAGRPDAKQGNPARRASARAGGRAEAGQGNPVGRAGAGRWEWRGWAALLAEGLPGAELHMLASNGALAADVEQDQLPRALLLRPDVASVVFGVNDTLRSGFDPARIDAAATHIVGALRAAGAEVLTMRLPDPGRMLGLPGALARPLARRAGEINAVMDGVAERFGTLHFDAAGDAETYDPRMWAVDRLHPSERGHRLIARRFHSRLAAAGHPVGEPPDPEPGNPPPTRLAEVCWMATKGTAWVVRRSTDLVPSLLMMAAREWWPSSGQAANEREHAGSTPG
jgi:lysophospholipase L1-like esterase